MNTKTMAIIIAAIVIVVALIAVGRAATDNDKHESGNYYVTYYGNGGVLNRETSYTLNKTVVDSNYFTREGYEFVCWNTEPDGSGTEYHYGEDVARGTNLYAIWKEKPPE